MPHQTSDVLVVGAKVMAAGAEVRGIGEIASYPDTGGMVKVRYFTSPTSYAEREVHTSKLRPVEIPAQTRCFIQGPAGFRMGRVVLAKTSPPLAVYEIAFPNRELEDLAETDFHVRSYLIGNSSVATLAALGQETPFFFDKRSALLSKYFQQLSHCHGLLGLISAKIELFPHQVEVARRVLQDPQIRYLLADEVGLGKTVEAGIVLRQLSLDRPQLPMVVFAPSVLTGQWESELAERFDLPDVTVKAHEDLEDHKPSGGIVVIDEAHRIVDGSLFEAACRLTSPSASPHLLLLSATPILHHERQFLGLLHLLDPEVYRLDAFEEFRSRLLNRRELGRTLLALSRSSRAAFVMRHVRKVGELLPLDASVQKLVAAAESAQASAEAEAGLALAVTHLRVHLTETYRVHRRLLRTRRATLLEEGDISQQRRECGPCYLDSSVSASILNLWERLEDWRVGAVAYVAGNPQEDAAVWVKRYLDMATAVASNRESGSIFENVGQPSFPGEAEILEDLRSQAKKIGVQPVSAALLGFLSRREQTSEQWVVFCATAAVAVQLARAVDKGWTGKVFVVTQDDDDVERSESLDGFKDSPRSVLFTDATLEEGYNLQFARGLILLDLPFHPMRLEQRVGRLDRLDRRGTVECVALLSHRDGGVALDTTWYEVLSRGLGLFNASLADLQYLCERELETLGRVTFEGGPSALAREIPRISELILAEREAGAEQDILDGIDVSGLRDTLLWKNLESADECEDAFGKALVTYLSKSLNLSVQFETEHGIPGSMFEFGMGRNRVPLLPATVLKGIGRYSHSKSTVNRTLAARRRQLEFLRPGHPFVEQMRVLAEWDDRGQAFAMWRRAPGVTVPRLVFRFVLRSAAAVESVWRDTQRDSVDLNREGLQRLVESWFPTRYWQFLVDDQGRSVPQDIANLCRSPYDNQFDINLGGERSYALQEVVGAEEWPRLCRNMATGVTEALKAHSAFAKLRTGAQQAALEYFATIRARLHARSGDARLGYGDSQSELAIQELRADLCEKVLSAPLVSVDSCGAYVLSQEPVCPR